MPEEKEIIRGPKKRQRRRLRKKGHTYGRIVLVGNPNVGKSVIFGLLTGKYVTVSNYPGTTVEVSYGNIRVGEKEYLVIDSPGVNNLIPMSEDEKVTRDILLREKPETVVLVVDAKNLKRGLMLLSQLSEMEIPCLLDLNMEDEAKARGIEIDYKKLSEILNIQVVGTVAPQRKGMNKLRGTLLQSHAPSIKTDYGDVIEDYAARIADLLPEAPISRRSIALMILAGDESLKDWLMAHITNEIIQEIEDLRDEAQSKLKEPISHIIGHTRINIAERIAQKVFRNDVSETSIFAAKLNSWTIHPVFGIPILLLVMFAFYELVGQFGAGTLVDFLEENIFGAYVNPAIERLVTSFVPFDFFQDMLVGQYGIFTMAVKYALGIILPITATFFPGVRFSRGQRVSPETRCPLKQGLQTYWPEWKSYITPRPWSGLRDNGYYDDENTRNTEGTSHCNFSYRSCRTVFSPAWCNFRYARLLAYTCSSLVGRHSHNCSLVCGFPFFKTDSRGKAGFLH